jgi:hypothetical protein
MKRANTNEFPSLFFEHHVLTHHINDVGALLNGVDGAGVQTGHRHVSILRAPMPFWLFSTMRHGWQVSSEPPCRGC